MSTVLIVDDSPITRDLLYEILANAGYDIIGEAGDGQEAFELYQKLGPDLVTMDITMENVDGLRSLKMIREYDPEASVVMCSAMGEQKMVIESIKAGAKEFIVKPFDVKDVLAAVEKALGGA